MNESLTPITLLPSDRSSRPCASFQLNYTPRSQMREFQTLPLKCSHLLLSQLPKRSKRVSYELAGKGWAGQLGCAVLGWAGLS